MTNYTRSQLIARDSVHQHRGKPARISEILMGAMFVGTIVFLLWGLPAVVRFSN